MRLNEIAPPSYVGPLDKAITQVAQMADQVNYKAGLLRGSSNKGPLTQMRVRQDRTPLDATMAASVIFNYWIEQKTGIPNVRFRAMYATTSYKAAEDYANGAVYCVLPPNDATVVYHPELSDSLQLLKRINRSLLEINDMIGEIELSSADPASVSIQKIMDELQPDEIEAFKQLLSTPAPRMAGYVAGKAGDLQLVSSEGINHPEIMIVDVSSVWAFNAELLHEWDPEIHGTQYSSALTHLVDKALKNK